MITRIIQDFMTEEEIKVAETICDAHEAQLLNYLRATKIEYGLLLNFGSKPQFKRKAWTNKYHG